MLLEVNLVKTQSINESKAKLLDRRRYPIQDESLAINAVEKFISESMPTFTAALTDKTMLARLRGIKGLTVQDLDCLRYYLATKGLDIWYYAVSTTEVNSDEIPEGQVEFNVIDNSHVRGFVPMCMKITQLQDSIKFSDVYSKIQTSYGLFEGATLSGFSNPLKSYIDGLKTDEELLGISNRGRTMYINSILEFLRKDLKVIIN